MSCRLARTTVRPCLQTENQSIVKNKQTNKKTEPTVTNWMPLAFVSSTPAKSTDTSLPFPPLPYSSDTPRWALPLASYSLKDALWTDWSLLSRLGNTCSKTVNKQAVCGAKKPTEPQPMVRVWKLGRSPSLCNLVNLCLQPRYKELRGRERVDFTFQGQETGEERPTRGNSRY